VPQIATVGLVGGFREDGAIGDPEEPAGFRRKLIAYRVLRAAELMGRASVTGQCGLTLAPGCGACPEEFCRTDGPLIGATSQYDKGIRLHNAAINAQDLLRKQKGR
jgi:hypothetical protein